MPSRVLVSGISRLPGLRRLPVFKLLALAEVAMLARTHFEKLEAHERRRLAELVRKGKGRPSSLGADERTELAALVARLEPRAFAGLAAGKLSPIPLPKRLLAGRGR